MPLKEFILPFMCAEYIAYRRIFLLKQLFLLRFIELAHKWR